MALNKVVWNLEELEEGGLRVRVWRLEDKESVEEPLVCVTTHPWGVLGGGEHNTIGVAQALAARGHIALTFTLPNSGLVWGTLSGHKAECNATVRVVDWASRRFETKRVVLIGSSAGAPVAGSCLDRHDAIVAAGFVGYTFGWLAWIGFGMHFKSVRSSEKKKLFIMGENDEFTSPAQLRSQAEASAGGNENNEVVIIKDVAHFELEQREHDAEVAEILHHRLLTKL